MITVSKQNGFTVLYVSIDDYLQGDDLPSRERKTRKEEYMKTLSYFIGAAQTAGLKVDVVGGAKDWSLTQNRWKGYELIDFVQEYNETYPQAKIRTLQYDVEPYLLSQYNADKQKVLKDFVSFIDESAYRMKNVDAGFSVVIPHFYDQAQNWTPTYTYKGHDGSTYTHLLRVLKQKDKDNTSLIIMAYRNFFEDENGTKAISEAEIEEATQGGYSTKIIIAQETGNVQPAYVTFYDYPKSSLIEAVRDIQNYFDEYDNFGGVAIHYFDPFLKME